MTQAGNGWNKFDQPAFGSPIGRAIWVLSAGPNGIVETPFEGAGAPHGDDIAARVR